LNFNDDYVISSQLLVSIILCDIFIDDADKESLSSNRYLSQRSAALVAKTKLNVKLALSGRSTRERIIEDERDDDNNEGMLTRDVHATYLPSPLMGLSLGFLYQGDNNDKDNVIQRRKQKRSQINLNDVSKSSVNSNLGGGNEDNLPSIESMTSSSLNPTGSVAPTAHWVACDLCSKWRRLPAEVDVDALPEKWYCSMNMWDDEHNTCEVLNGYVCRLLLCS
jgi:hypothetical protein